MIERLVPDTIEWNLHSVEHLQRYEYFLGLCKGRRVLDAACGTGFGSYLIATSGAASVCAVDISLESIDYAKSRYSHPAITYQIGDCERLEELKAEFDVIISFETLEHLRHPERLVEGAQSLLTPGGLFICSTPNILRHSLAPDAVENTFHLSEMHYAEFREIMGKHFEVQAAYHQSEDKCYRRYLQFVETLDNMYNALEVSKLLRLERSLRKLFGRRALALPDIPCSLKFPVEGDWIMEEVDTPRDWHKTYIIVGKRYG